MDKLEALRRYFGYDSFRSGQEALVDALLGSRDVLGVMPTGAGKSLCYQLPAILQPGTALVVSPLISLMQDQVRALGEAGVHAAYLNSALTEGQYTRALQNAAQGCYKLVYVAPERLLTPRFLQFAQRAPLSLLAVDEAHCVSQWGQDFRPAYLQIGDFLQALPQRPPVAAFTATATDQVRADIVRLLALQDPLCRVTGFDRPNLRFELRHPKDKRAELLSLLRGFTGESGIVYCATRKAVEEVCGCLLENGFSAAPYHAGLSKQQRQQHQEDFLYSRVQIMVATNAFGMGIDKPDVRYVVHYNMPKDVESYYQEAGRAGRDGAPAQCVLLYSPLDVHTAEFLIEHERESDTLEPQVRAQVQALDRARLRQMVNYSTSKRCLRHFLLSYFGEQAPAHCGNCSNCDPAGEVDITVDAQKILCCVKRTGERYGLSLITGILRGARTQRILELGLERHRCWGLLRGMRAEQIRERIQWLTELQCLSVSDGTYPVLSLGPAAPGVLFHGEKVRMRVADGAAAKSTRKDRRYALQGDEAAQALYERLRALRDHLARSKGVPSYVIFGEESLRAMALSKPATPQALLAVYGVGQYKLEHYGDQFLSCIAAYQAQQANGQTG